MQPAANFFRQLDWLRIAVKLDRFLRLIYHQLAFVAFAEMAFQLFRCCYGQFAVEKIGKFVDDVVAIQFAPPRPK